MSLFGIIGAVLTFLGGTLLSWSAFQEDKRLKALQGAARLLADKRAASCWDGTPINTVEDFEVCLAKRDQKRAQAGYALMTIGFLLDLIDRLLPGMVKG